MRRSYAVHATGNRAGTPDPRHNRMMVDDCSLQVPVALDEGTHFSVICGSPSRNPSITVMAQWAALPPGERAFHAA